MFDQVTEPVLLHTVDKLEKFMANVLSLVNVHTDYFFCVLCSPSAWCSVSCHHTEDWSITDSG